MFIRTEKGLIDISENHLRFVDSPRKIKIYADNYKLFGIISYGEGFLLEVKYSNIFIIIILDSSLNEINRINNAIFKYISNDKIIYHNTITHDIFQSIDEIYSIEFSFRWTYLKNKIADSLPNLSGNVPEKIGKYTIIHKKSTLTFIERDVITADVIDAIYVFDHLVLLYKNSVEFYYKSKLVHVIIGQFEGIFFHKSIVKLYKDDFTYITFNVGRLLSEIKYINNFTDVLINCKN